MVYAVRNGGGGVGQDNLYVASSFYYVAAEAVGIIASNTPSAKATPAAFRASAEKACQLSVEEAKIAYPNIIDGDVHTCAWTLPTSTLCSWMALAWSRQREINVVDKVKHGEQYVEAAWPLGTAIEAVSTEK
ncbi:unnamed protein product [Urochloa humidicola]